MQSSDDIWKDVSPDETPLVFRKTDSLKTVRGSAFKYVSLRDYKKIDQLVIEQSKKESKTVISETPPQSWAGQQDRLFKLQNILKRFEKKSKDE